MKILIAGAEGQLGRAFQTFLRDTPDCRVIALSHQELDITSLRQVEQILSDQTIDLVINAAAYNAVDKAESEPEKAMAANKIGPENLALVTAQKRTMFVHVSTDYVFDGNRTYPYIESDKTNPLSVYGKSKLEGEKVVLGNNPKAYVVRTAWLYHTTGRNFPLTIFNLRKQPEIRVVNDQFGSPTYAPHLARKIIEMIKARAPFGLYHLAGLGGCSWFNFAEELFHQTGLTTPIKPMSLNDYAHAAPRPRYTVLATDKEPAFLLPPWEQGVADFVRDFKETHVRTISL